MKIKDDIEERLKKYSKKFDEYIQENNKNSYEVVEGIIPILISAPHSVRQLRNGKIKGKDLNTGPIVLEVANQTKCFAIYKIFNNQDDANYDIKNNNYKKEVLEIIKKYNIKIFLDIHGASNTEEFDIDLGTDNFNNLNGKKEIVEKFIQICKKNKIHKIGIDKKFKASTLHTITKTVAVNTNIPAMQIEIVKKYRDINDIENMKKVIKSIVDFINESV